MVLCKSHSQIWKNSKRWSAATADYPPYITDRGDFTSLCRDESVVWWLAVHSSCWCKQQACKNRLNNSPVMCMWWYMKLSCTLVVILISHRELLKQWTESWIWTLIISCHFEHIQSNASFLIHAYKTFPVALARNLTCSTKTYFDEDGIMATIPPGDTSPKRLPTMHFRFSPVNSQKKISMQGTNAPLCHRR